MTREDGMKLNVGCAQRSIKPVDSEKMTYELERFLLFYRLGLSRPLTRETS